MLTTARLILRPPRSVDETPAMIEADLPREWTGGAAERPAV